MGVAAPLALAATGLSAGSKLIAGDTAASNDRTQAVNAILQGQESQALHNFRAKNLDIDATYGQAKASETDTFMRDQLVGALANISAVRASANVAGDSPTGAAIENRVEALSDTARQQRLANINAQIATDRSGAAMERAAGISAMSMAQINAATDESNASAARLTGDLGGLGGLLSGISGAIKA
jgi:hypothetical protein